MRKDEEEGGRGEAGRKEGRKGEWGKEEGVRRKG